jgi:hypothetical protein
VRSVSDLNMNLVLFGEKHTVCPRPLLQLDWARSYIHINLINGARPLWGPV